MKLFLSTILLFCVVSLWSQISLPEYGIKRYGNTLDESFHTARTISQDSLGRILAYTSLNKNFYFIFDGKDFSFVREFESDQFLLRKDSIGLWGVEDAFTLVLSTPTDTFRIDTRAYTERNISRIRKFGAFYYLFANDGLLKLSYADNQLEVVSAHKYGTEVIRAVHITRDTIYLKHRKEQSYVLQDELDKRVTYEAPKPNADEIIILPNQEVVPSVFSPFKAFLINSDYKAVNPMVDSKGIMWAYLRGEESGVYKIEPNTGRKEKLDLGLDSGTYCDFFEDDIGDIWIGTYGEGLLHLYDKSINVLGKEIGLESNNIWSVFQKRDGGILLSEGCSGLQEIKDGNIKSITNSCHGSVFEDSKGRIWATSYGVQLIKDGVVKELGKSDGLYSGTILSVFEDSHQDVWFGTRRALHKYLDGKFKQYVIEDTDVYDRIYNIVEAQKGKLLLALDNGAFYYFQDEKFTKLSFELKEASHLFHDLDGDIWLASEGEGLYYFKNDTFEKIEAENLAKNIRFLQHSRDGNIWGLCSDNEIFFAKKSDLLERDREPSINYIASGDGLPLFSTNTRLQPSSAILDDGSIVFPNIHGAIHINPTKYNRSRPDYQTIISINADEIKDVKQYESGDTKKYIDLIVNAIYLNPEARILNQYKLGNRQWQSLSNGVAERIDLNDFKTNLKVRSKHINGEWKLIKDVNIRIEKPYYIQGWFLALLALSALGLVFFFVRLRTISILAQKRMLEQKVEEQTAALSEEKVQLSSMLEKQQLLTQQLNLAQATKNRMYAQLSHEFKSPLQTISSFLRSSSSVLNTDEKDRVIRNVNSLLASSEEILELSKAETGKLKLKTNHYNINGIIREQIELKTLLAAERNIEITFANFDQTVYLECDMQQIQKVIGNLLSNAIKFSNASSAITVESIEEDGYQYIRVQDHGRGIPTEEIPQLTQAYFQASNNEHRGTGIGLSLSEEILKLHESKLEVESKLGEGSIFSFKLKLPEESQADILRLYRSSESTAQQLKGHIQESKKTVLIVDDNQDVLHYLRLILQEHYNVFTATQGIDGLEIAVHHTVDLIISDVNMPIMSGIELLQNIRSNEKLESIPFMLLTGSQSEETENLSIKSGADFVLKKPVNERYLLPKIRQLLKRQSLLLNQANKAIAHDLLPPGIMDDDKELMGKVESAILANLDNSKLKSKDIARLVGVGEKTLRNKVKSISGYTLKEYLRQYRLKKAKILIDQNYGTKSEIAVATGFSSLSYFSKSYNAWITEEE